MNRLYYGDNLTIMQQMPKYSVDLIYLDPPFNSQQNYNLLYRTMTGKPVPEQAEAFCDTWEMDAQKEAIARSMPVLMREHGIDDYYVDFWRIWMQALRNTQPHLLAYLIYMVQRLLYMKSILRPTGSIYLHCDPTASHYIKVMMDGIFGHSNFRNEIIWRRTGSHTPSRRYSPIHDVIFYYTVSNNYTFNRLTRPYMKGHVEKAFIKEGERYRTNYSGNVLTGSGKRNGISGRPWRGFDPTSKNRHWALPSRLLDGIEDQFEGLNQHEKFDKLFEMGVITIKDTDEWPRYQRYIMPQDGQYLSDIWAYQPYTEGTVFGTDDGIDDDVRWMGSKDGDRLGYPTQKPVSLLERIIRSSSKPGDVVFDPFCGCGTTIYAAHLIGNRQWIGCDIAILAIRLIRETLSERYRLVENTHYTVDGIPTSVEGAQELFDKDPSTFQKWFVERIGGFPSTRTTADRGIDGRIYFETRNGLREMMLQVKGGRTVRPTDIRDLRGVLEREENAEMAGFLSMVPASRAMRDEGAAAGIYEYQGVEYPRIQFLTAHDVLVDKREFHMPTKVNTRISTGQQNLALSGTHPGGN